MVNRPFPCSHWRRAKFLSRFRLFFRYNSKAKVIIYAWVNEENTLRKAGSSAAG
jgi:toxin YhaV